MQHPVCTVLEKNTGEQMAPVIERRNSFLGGKSGLWVVIASTRQVREGRPFVADTQFCLRNEPVGAGGLFVERLRLDLGGLGRSLAAHRLFGRSLGTLLFHPGPPPEPTRSDGEE